jgi:hypothetical protein
MAITINHAFVSAKGDGSDATLVRPSNWNASHNLNMATSKIVGRVTAGPGLAEELPASTFMINLLNTADIAALAIALGLPTTGDALLTFKTVATSGWVMMNDGSIGDATSGANFAASTTQALFTLFYNNVSDANAPLQTSTGVGTSRGAQGAAATAYGNHCRMVLPKALGRAIIIGGPGAGLTNRALGSIGGEESHQLLPVEVPDHTHTVTPTGGITATDINHTHQQQGTYTSGTVSQDHSHTQQGTFGTGTMNSNNVHNHGVSGGVKGGAGAGVFAGGGFSAPASASDISINNTDINHTHNVTISGQTGGISANHTHTVTLFGGTGYMDQSNPHAHSFVGNLNTTSGAGFGWGFHNNMQPFTAWNVMVKL